jgi:hypothetical protein
VEDDTDIQIYFYIPIRIRCNSSYVPLRTRSGKEFYIKILFKGGIKMSPLSSTPFMPSSDWGWVSVPIKDYKPEEKKPAPKEYPSDAPSLVKQGNYR